MTIKKRSSGKQSKTIDITDPDSIQGTQKAIGGSQSDHWNLILLNQAIRTLWTGHSDEEARNRQYKATAATLLGWLRKMKSKG